MNPFEYGKTFHNKSFTKKIGALTPSNPKIFNGAQICSNRPVLIGLIKSLTCKETNSSATCSSGGWKLSVESGIQKQLNYWTSDWKYR